MHEEPIKIEILNEDEKPFVPEQPARSAFKEKAGEAGKKVAGTAASTAKKAWDSNARKKVTGGVKKGATKVATKGTQLVQDKVVQVAEQQAKERVAAAQTKMRETDWKHEAQAGTVRGLRWLSQKFSDLAERFSQPRKPNDETVESNEGGVG